MSNYTQLSTESSNNLNNLEDFATEMNSTKTNMRIFIITQAKTQLEKVLNLTNKLDEWTNIYINKVDERILDSDISPEEISSYMNQITNMIDRSFKMIKEVSSDEKLLNLTYLDLSQNINTNVSNSNSSFSNITDVNSRVKIRETVKAVIDYINTNGDNLVNI